MQSHRLQLNRRSSSGAALRRRRHIPDGDFHVNADQVKPVSAARNLGVFVDGEMSIRTHLSHVTASCFSARRQIRSIRRSLPSAARLEMLVCSLVHSRLNYCNAVFAGMPVCDIRRLQSVLKSSVRLVTGAWKYGHVTSLLRDRHWLPIAERIKFHRCLQGNAPRYHADHVALTSSVGRRSSLRSADTFTLEVLRTRLSFGDRAFSVAGPRTWNSLPINVRPAHSMYSFRKLFLNVFIPACVFST